MRNQGEILAPYKSEQQEVGVKIDWGTITTTAALFQISPAQPAVTASGDLTMTVSNATGAWNCRPMVSSAPDLRGFASVMFLNQVLQPAELAERGNDAPGVPDFTASAGLEMGYSRVEDCLWNGRIIYASGSYLTAANTLKFPAGRASIWAPAMETVVNRDAGHHPPECRKRLRRDHWLTTGNFVTVGVAPNLHRIGCDEVLTT